MIKKNTVRSIQATQEKADILIQALPYLRRFASKVVVVKIGGELVDDQERAKQFVEDVSFLSTAGIKVVVVHGGGPQISRAMQHFQIEPRFVDGHRVTDKDTLEITSMVLLGSINQKLVALFNSKGVRAMGLTGTDAQMLRVRQKNEALGYVGEIEEVNVDPLERLLSLNCLPVVASLGTSLDGQTYNINADSAAGRIASALRAEKYIMLTNVEGLFETFGDDQSLIAQIDLESLGALRDSGKLSVGMLPKVDSVLHAVKSGVPKAHILDGRVQHALLLEIFTPEGIGTMVSKEI